MSETDCRLYIDTDDDRTIVQAAIDAYLRQAFQELVVDAPVFRNVDFTFDARARRQYDPIRCSPLTAEVGAIDESPGSAEPFQVGLIDLIVELRGRGYLVTAACDFEERVAKATGWNWSVQTTEPPGRIKA